MEKKTLIAYQDKSGALITDFVDTKLYNEYMIRLHNESRNREKYKDPASQKASVYYTPC